MPAQSGPPEGVVALLFTDIEGSTRLARAAGQRWRSIRGCHHEILRAAIESNHGWVDSAEGDSFFATFADPVDGARAAMDAQRALAREPWPDGMSVRVRMGLHVGHVERVDDAYLGLEVHRAARISAVGHGGEVLLSSAARAVLGDAVTVDDLGLHRLKDFPAPEHLYCIVVDGRGAADFPPLRTLELRPTNLTSPAPDLVGRENDLGRLLTTVRDGARLVTLTGAGGCGKSSVALVAAERLLPDFPGGVWWVPLATVTEAGDVLQHVAERVRADLGGRQSLTDGLAARFGDARTLLLLDNTEQLVDAAADLRVLLDRLPGLQVLATSQLPFGLRDELLVHLDPLPPSDAVALFMRRARSVRPGWQPTPEDRTAIEAVCRQLDGLPLSVELAAARLAILTPSQLLDRLAHPLEVLQRGGRGDLPRHRSLRSTLEWTLEMLQPGPRRLFTVLGTFAGSMSAADVEIVCGEPATLDWLGELLEVAVLQRDETDGELRLRLPEAVRQLAAEDLTRSPDEQQHRRAHAGWVLGVMHAARLYAAAPAEVYPAAARADADATLALAWAKDHDEDVFYRLAAAWAFVLSFEGRMRQCEELLSCLFAAPASSLPLPPLPVTARVAALAAAGVWAGGHGDAAAAVARLTEALEVDSDDVAFRVILLESRGIWRGFNGDHREAIEDCVAASQLASTMDVTIRAGVALGEAQVRLDAGETDRAAALVDAAAEMCRGRSCWAEAGLPTAQGDVALALGRPRLALRHHMQSLAQSERLANDAQLFFDLMTIHGDLVAAGDPLGALEVLEMGRHHAAEVFGTADFADRFAIPEASALVGGAADDARRRAAQVPRAERTNRVRAIIRDLPPDGD